MTETRARPALSFITVAVLMLIILVAGGTAIYFIQARVYPTHLILVVLDTVRADHLGCYGYQRPTTPELDRFAASGLRFAEARATSPWTLPSHASLFTGSVSRSHGCHFEHRYLVNSRVTLAERLQQAHGYETFGVSSNVNISSLYHMDQGFDEFHEVWEERREFPGLDDSAIVNEIVAQWLKQRKRKVPFFLFLNYMDAHLPYQPPPAVLREFGSVSRRVAEAAANPDLLRSVLKGETVLDQELIAGLTDFYDAELRVLDGYIGQLLRLLDAQGVTEHSMIVITSDHGELLGEDGLVDHQLSLREELLRVPLLVQFSRHPLPAVIEEPVPLTSIHDWFLEAAVGRIPEWTPPPDRARSVEVAEYFQPVDLQQAVPLDHPLFPVTRQRQTALRWHDQDRRFKYVAWSDGTEFLYDLQEGETALRVADHESMVIRFRRELSDHRAKSGFVESPEDLVEANPTQPTKAQTELRQLGYTAPPVSTRLGIHASEHWRAALRALEADQREVASRRIREALQMAPNHPGVLFDAARVADANNAVEALALFQRYVNTVTGTPLQNSEYFQHASRRIRELRGQ